MQTTQTIGVIRWTLIPVTAKLERIKRIKQLSFIQADGERRAKGDAERLERERFTLIKGQRRDVDDDGQPGHRAKYKHDGAQDPHPSVEPSGQIL